MIGMTTTQLRHLTERVILALSEVRDPKALDILTHGAAVELGLDPVGFAEFVRRARA